MIIYVQYNNTMNLRFIKWWRNDEIYKFKKTIKV